MGLLAASSSSSFIIVIWILVFVGIFYFMAIRPQRRQRQKHGDLLSMLKKGDEVITIGGMYGTVKKIGDDYVELEIANRTRVKFLKRSISSIVSEEEEEEYEEEPVDETDEVVDGDAEETESGDESDAAVDEAVDADDEESSTR
ncbi:MAG: preprotein translocase subunit YajC [Thermoleophilia bacterium]